MDAENDMPCHSTNDPSSVDVSAGESRATEFCNGRGNTLPQPSTTSPSSTSSQPRDNKRKASGLATWKNQKGSLPDSCETVNQLERFNPTVEASNHDLRPGAVSVQEISSLGSHLDTIHHDVESGDNLHDNALPSLIVAAEVVDDPSQEPPNYGPGSTAWERHVQEEVESRLFQQKQNLAIAEAFTVVTGATDTGISDVTNSQEANIDMTNQRRGLRRKVLCSVVGILFLAGAVFGGVQLGATLQDDSSTQKSQLVNNSSEQQVPDTDVASQQPATLQVSPSPKPVPVANSPSLLPVDVSDSPSAQPEQVTSAPSKLPVDISDSPSAQPERATRAPSRQPLPVTTIPSRQPVPVTGSPTPKPISVSPTPKPIPVSPTPQVEQEDEAEVDDDDTDEADDSDNDDDNDKEDETDDDDKADDDDNTDDDDG